MMFPMVLPSAPAMIVGMKSKLPVLTKYPAIIYRSCDDGRLAIPFVSIRIKIAKYEPEEMRVWRSIKVSIPVSSGQ